jgi:hypothetical protein
VKRKYTVGIEVIRAYVIEVEANTAGEALQKAEELTPEFIDNNGEYVDTHTLIEDEPELLEEQ